MIHALLLAAALAAAPFSSSSSNTLRAQQGPVYAVKDIGSFDSLVASRVSDPTWLLGSGCGGTPNYSIAAGAADPTSGFMDAVDMNALSNTTAAYFSTRFATPPGVTGVTFTAFLQAGTGNTGTTAVLFSPPNCSSATPSNLVTPTGTMAPYSVSISGLTPGLIPSGGTGQVPFIAVNQAGFGTTAKGRPLVGTVQVKPTTGASGFWAADFYRVAADAKTLWYNTRDERWADGQFNHSSHVEMHADTDATTLAIAVEAVGLGTPIVGRDTISIFVNGRPWSSFTPSASFDLEYVTLTGLPSGMKRVTVTSSTFLAGSQAPNSRDGVFLDALYFPASATTTILGQPYAPRRIVFYGDSIISGENGSIPVCSMQGTAAVLRKTAPGDVYMEAWGGRSLHGDVDNGSGGVSATNLAELMDFIARPDPTDVYVQIGFNDFFNSYTTLAQFTAQYTALLDAIHARLPTAKLYAQSAGLRQSANEGTANLNGNTVAQYRTNQLAACNARAWCTAIDGTTLYAQTDLGSGDDVHPSAEGSVVYARSIVTKLDSTALPASPATAIAVQPSQTLPTCAVTIEGSQVLKPSDGSTTNSKTCTCARTSGNVYKWVSVDNVAGTITATGNTTTCN